MCFATGALGFATALAALALRSRMNCRRARHASANERRHRCRGKCGNHHSRRAFFSRSSCEYRGDEAQVCASDRGCGGLGQQTACAGGEAAGRYPEAAAPERSRWRGCLSCVWLRAQRGGTERRRGCGRGGLRSRRGRRRVGRAWTRSLCCRVRVCAGDGCRFGSCASLPRAQGARLCRHRTPIVSAHFGLVFYS